MVKAVETNLATLLAGEKLYRVPLYQRTYSWGETQLAQLWDDLVETAEVHETGSARTHFVGSLVLAPSLFDPAGLNELIVVDGQQRLTTLTLLLAAIRDAANGTDREETRRRINGLYLLNEYRDGRPTKLLPTQADRDPYSACVYGSMQQASDHPVPHAYTFFRNRIDELQANSPLSLRRLEDTVATGLTVVSVTAHPDDNVHRIFESLNNTGLRLTQADLLRNYIFMRLGDSSDTIYRDVWLPLQDMLGPDGLELLFWLDIVMDDERARRSEVYLDQKRRLDRLETADAVAQDLRRVAALGTLLKTVLEPEREPSDGVGKRLKRLRDWGTTTAFPVILHILERRAAGEASDQQVEAALAMLESYFVRRVVVGNSTHGLNRALLQAVPAMRRADRVDVGLRDYLSTGRRGWASDAAVRHAARSVPFYRQGRAPQRAWILRWIEESLGGKEQAVTADLTIEHVLPQTLTPAWAREFGAGIPKGDVATEHAALVHTLGNLTLTGYNSELSNSPFTRKRTMLAQSRLAMNAEIAACEHWRPAEILARADVMAQRVIDLWPGPEASMGDELEVWQRLDAVLAALPPGRWATYGDVAAAIGTHPVPLGGRIANHPTPNAHRILRTGGRISPSFRWYEPGRFDDPRAVLEAEGLRFDAAGCAAAAQRLSVGELAALGGLDFQPGGMGDDETRQAFLAQAASLAGAEVAAGMEEVMIAWEELGGWLGYGKAAGSVSPMLGDGGSRGAIWPLVIYAGQYRSEVCVPVLRRRAPFTDETLVEELVTRLNKAPGVDLDLSAAHGGLLIGPEVFGDPAARAVITETLEWFADVARAAGW